MTVIKIMSFVSSSEQLQAGFNESYEYLKDMFSLIKPSQYLQMKWTYNALQPTDNSEFSR